MFYGRYAATYPQAPCQTPPTGTVVQGFANADPDTEMTLFRDDSRRELILTFPGTASLGDLVTDISAVMVPATIKGVNCTACLVHGGVLKSFNAIQPATQSVLDTAIAAYPSYTLILAGHSLGAALTKYAYASFKSQGYNISAAYSYGEFRNGNQAWADFVDGLSGNTDANQGPYYRVTHADDGVPQVLPTLTGWRHSRSEYWFSKGADGPSTTFRCYGQEPSDCEWNRIFRVVYEKLLLISIPPQATTRSWELVWLASTLRTFSIPASTSLVVEVSSRCRKICLNLNVSQLVACGREKPGTVLP